MKKTMLLLRAAMTAGLALALFLSCAQPANPEPTTTPAAPAGVTATAASFCRVIVRWTDNSDNESGFIIERSTDPAFGAGTITAIQAPANAAAWSDRAGLTAATVYYYRVLARNSAGASAAVGAPAGAVTGGAPAAPDGSRVADHTRINRVRSGTLPVAAIQAAKQNLHIGYGHTSHGSQLSSGMSGLVEFANGAGCAGAYTAEQNLFSYETGNTSGAVLDYREGNGLDGDCGYYPDWVTYTRSYLDNPAHWQVNVVIWSWCGQADSRDEQSMLNTYLTPMSELEEDYPDITFVYMTGHLVGSGTAGNLHQRNEQIRAFCASGDRWLFDFADIESYDPDGSVNYRALFASDACCYDADGDGTTETFPDDPATPNVNEADPTVAVGGDLNWATEWQASHTENTDWYDCGAAHSISLNANLKAYAAWWLWCRLAGWDD